MKKLLITAFALGLGALLFPITAKAETKTTYPIESNDNIDFDGKEHKIVLDDPGTSGDDTSDDISYTEYEVTVTRDGEPFTPAFHDGHYWVKDAGTYAVTIKDKEGGNYILATNEENPAMFIINSTMNMTINDVISDGYIESDTDIEEVNKISHILSHTEVKGIGDDTGVNAPKGTVFVSEEFYGEDKTATGIKEFEEQEITIVDGIVDFQHKWRHKGYHKLFFFYIPSDDEINYHAMKNSMLIYVNKGTDEFELSGVDATKEGSVWTLIKIFNDPDFTINIKPQSEKELASGDLTITMPETDILEIKDSTLSGDTRSFKPIENARNYSCSFSIKHAYEDEYFNITITKAEDENYKETIETIQIKIKRDDQELNITEPDDYVYDTESKSLGYGRCLTGDVYYSVNDGEETLEEPFATDVNTYNIKCFVKQSRDYNEIIKNYTVLITKGQVVITLDRDVPVTYVYDKGFKSFAYGSTNLGEVLYTQNGAQTDSPGSTEAGEYTIKCFVPSTDNYDGAETTYKVTIEKADPLLSATLSDGTVIENIPGEIKSGNRQILHYNGQKQSLGSAVCLTDAPIELTVNKNKVAAEAVNVGVYKVSWKVAERANYKSAEIQYTVTITPESLKLKSSSGMDYGSGRIISNDLTKLIQGIDSLWELALSIEDNLN